MTNTNTAPFISTLICQHVTYTNIHPVHYIDFVFWDYNAVTKALRNKVPRENTWKHLEFGFVEMLAIFVFIRAYEGMPCVFCQYYNYADTLCKQNQPKQ